MSKIDELAKLIVDIIEKKDSKKPRALDTVGTVTRVDGDYAWIRLAGSEEETPVKETITVKKGDKVQVRASKGSAWIVGNETAPPTDDTLAKKAMENSDKASGMAKRASDMTIVNDTLYYLASDQEEGVTTEDEGWTKEPQEVTESLPYLWAYHDYERGNGKHFKSEPIIIAMYAEDGKGIDTLTTYYALGTSTSIAPTTGWATSFTYLSGYYIWRKELITYDDGTTKWTTAVYDAGLTQSSSLSYDTAQYIWTESTGSTDVPTGQYVTEVPKASYKSNPSGGSLLVRSVGLYLRYAAKTLVELVAAGLKIYDPTDSTYPAAQFLSSGAVIGKDYSNQIIVDGNGIKFNYAQNSHPAVFAVSPRSSYGIALTLEAARFYVDAPVEFHYLVTAESMSTGDISADDISAKTITARNIQCGQISIIPTADTPSYMDVTFDKTFPSAPQVVVTPESTVAGTTLKGWAATNITTTGFRAWVTRANTTTTTLHWIAIS